MVVQLAIVTNHSTTKIILATLTGHSSAGGVMHSQEGISHHVFVNHEFINNHQHMNVMMSVSYDLLNPPISQTATVIPMEMSLKWISPLNHGGRSLRHLAPWGGQLHPGSHGLHDLINLAVDIWITRWRLPRMPTNVMKRGSL